MLLISSRVQDVQDAEDAEERSSEATHRQATLRRRLGTPGPPPQRDEVSGAQCWQTPDRESR